MDRAYLYLDEDTFERWRNAIFTAPRHASQYDQMQRGVLPEEEHDALTLLFLHRLLTTSRELLDRYTHAQIDAGFVEVLGKRSYLDVLAEAVLPLPLRCECLAGMTSLFRDVFSIVYGNTLGHMNQCTRDGIPNSACYMWWEVDPVLGWVEGAEVHAAFVQHVTDVLKLDSEACCESALHGLGHWNGPQGRKWVEDLIDEWLAARPHASPLLRRYAGWARSRRVQ